MVKNKTWNHLWDLFHEAAALAEPERSSFLDDCCAGDPDLRAELDSLLRAAGEADEIFAPPPRPPDSAESQLDSLLRDDDDTPEFPSLTGRTIGRFTLGRLLGEGGAGVVYEATRENPRLTLALKLLRFGLTSPEAHRRFHYESRILAHLRHPGIAAIHETGTHDDGAGATPWFALELIPDAKTITDYADDQKLNTDERIRLFLQVCAAVGYAHQRGVIHRDLKPANVLVNEHGQTKIIDYGIARATDADLTLTSTPPDSPDSDESAAAGDPSSGGGLAGTLGYMAPEQTKGDPDALDHRCDVYALGALLYMLLTGRPALDLHHTPLLEAISIIRTRPPIHPRVHHPTYRGFRGDLGDLMMTALEKEPEDRYPSAADLARDLEHYLKSEPLEIKPPTKLRRAILFARRNKALLGGVAATFVVLVAGIIGTSTALILAHQREQETKTQIEITQAVNQFLNNDLLAAVAPSAKAGKGKDVLMREVLDIASEKIEEQSQPEGRFADKPLVEASIRATLGDTYLKLGEFQLAEPHLERARELGLRELGPEHPSTLNSMNNLASLYQNQGRFGKAEPLYLQTLETQKRILGPEHVSTLGTMTNLAVLYMGQGRYEKAEPLYLETLELMRRVLGEEATFTLNCMENLALLYKKQRRFNDAEPLILQALEKRKRILGSEHPDTLASINSLANLYARQGRYDEAEPLILQTLETQKRILGLEHRSTLATMHSLASRYFEQRQYEKAEQLYLETLELMRRVLGEEAPFTLNCMATLALLYRSQGRYDEAEPLILQTLETQKRILGPEHPITLETMNNLGVLYQNQGRYEKAEPLYLETMELMQRVLGEEAPSTLNCMASLAILYKSQGRYDEAEPLYLQTLEIQKRILGPEHTATLGTMTNLGLLYLNLNRLEDAEDLLTRSLALKRRVLGINHLFTRICMNGLIDLYTRQERSDEARALQMELDTWTITQNKKKAEKPDATADDLNSLAWTLLTAEPADIRDPPAALKFALRACEITNYEHLGFLDTLALAHHLTGDNRSAVETAQSALTHLSPDDPSRGNYEAALTRYEDALSEQNSPGEEDPHGQK